MTFPKKYSISESIQTIKPLLPPKLITFDAYNTLYCSSIPVLEQYASIARKYGIIIDPNNLVKRFPECFKKLTKIHPNYGKYTNITGDEWWSILIKDLFQPHDVPQDMISKIVTHFKTKKAYSTYPDIIEFIKAIKLKYPDIILGVISNTDPAVYDLLKNLNLFQYFTPYTYFSYDLEISKPNPKIFDYVINDVLKKNPEITNGLLDRQSLLKHCWHIGDEIEKDMLAAENAGWNGILVDRLDKHGYLGDYSSKRSMTEHELLLDKIDQHVQNIWEICHAKDWFVQLNERTFVVPNIRVVKHIFLQE